MSLRKSVVAFEPDSSLVLLDSRYRKNPNDSPYSFESNLSCGLRGQKFIYKGLSWTQPLFSHNTTNNEIRFKLFGEDSNETLVCYAMPFVLYNSFDGNDDSSYYQPPLPGSYGYDIQFAFNNDVRLLSSNLVLYTPTVNGNNVQFFFHYNPSRGFVLYCQLVADGTPVPIQLLDCSWISNAHFVHGFGQYNITLNKVTPVTDETVFNPAIHGSTASLLPTRYISVVCKEISVDRAFPSITNTSDSDLPFEIGVFFVKHEWTGVYNTEKSTGDETVIPLKFGTEHQILRLDIKDETGKALICGNPIQNLLDDTFIPSYVKDDLINAGGRNLLAINMLTFGDTFEIETAPADIETFVITGFYQNDYVVAVPAFNARAMFKVPFDFNSCSRWSSFSAFKPFSSSPSSFRYNPYVLSNLRSLRLQFDLNMTLDVAFDPFVTMFFRLYFRDQNTNPPVDYLVSFNVRNVAYWVGALNVVLPFTIHALQIPRAVCERTTFEMILQINVNAGNGGNLTFNANVNNEIEFRQRNVDASKYYEPGKIGKYGLPFTDALCDETVHAISIQLN
jgi:hypothetical protein